MAPVTQDERIRQLSDPEFLNDLSSLQRWLMFGFLIRILSVPVLVVDLTLPISGGFAFAGMVLLGNSIILLALIMLGNRLYEDWGSIILIVLGVFIPLIGLIVILRVNSKANRTLRGAGWDVGFFGARRKPN